MKYLLKVYSGMFAVYLMFMTVGAFFYFLAFMALGFGMTLQSIAPHLFTVSSIYALFCLVFVNIPELRVDTFVRTVSGATITLMIGCVLLYLIQSPLYVLVVLGILPSAILMVVTLLMNFYWKSRL